MYVRRGFGQQAAVFYAYDPVPPYIPYVAKPIPADTAPAPKQDPTKPRPVFAGGNPNFDETTGCFTGPEAYKNPPASCRPTTPASGVTQSAVPSWVWWLGGGLLILTLAK